MIAILSLTAARMVGVIALSLWWTRKERER